jgi:hypothetical protein
MVHHDQYPVRAQDRRFASKQVDTPQTHIADHAPENHDRRATRARVERWPAVAVPVTGQPSRPGSGSTLMLSIRTSMRLAAASARVGPTITPKAGVRGTPPCRRAVNIFLAIARNRRTSGFQPYLRAADANCRKVPTLEGLLHQIEVSIDPALADNQFRPAVAIDQKMR